MEDRDLHASVHAGVTCTNGGSTLVKVRDFRFRYFMRVLHGSGFWQDGKVVGLPSPLAKKPHFWLLVWTWTPDERYLVCEQRNQYKSPRSSGVLGLGRHIERTYWIHLVLKTPYLLSVNSVSKQKNMQQPCELARPCACPRLS